MGRTACVTILVLSLLCCRVVALRADDALPRARQLADTHARYDEAERAYRQLIDEAAGDQRPVVASQARRCWAELAGLYERLGEIDAAAGLYEQAVARGGFA